MQKKIEKKNILAAAVRFALHRIVAKMSNYEQYANVSPAYANGRQPVALNTVLGAAIEAAQRTGVASVASCRVLDAGCGTGNYALALAPFVRHVDAIDADDGMLAQARTIAAQAAPSHSNVEFSHMDLRDVSHLQAGSVDLINCAQVLHHLVDEDAANVQGKFDVVQRLLCSFYRLLVPGGALVLHLTLRDQALHGYWWSHLVPQACERFSQRVPQREAMEQMLCNAGFEAQPYVCATLSEHLQSKDVYEQPYGPLEQSWRNTVSIWSLATSADVAALCHNLHTIRSNEQRDANWRALVQQKIKKGDEYGQNTVFVAFKPK